MFVVINKHNVEQEQKSITEMSEQKNLVNPASSDCDVDKSWEPAVSELSLFLSFSMLTFREDLLFCGCFLSPTTGVGKDSIVGVEDKSISGLSVIN